MVVPAVAEQARGAGCSQRGAAAGVGDPWALERGHRAGGRGAGQDRRRAERRRRIQSTLIC